MWGSAKFGFRLVGSVSVQGHFLFWAFMPCSDLENSWAALCIVSHTLRYSDVGITGDELIHVLQSSEDLCLSSDDPADGLIVMRSYPVRA